MVLSEESAGPVYETSPYPVTDRPLASLPYKAPRISMAMLITKPLPLVLVKRPEASTRISPAVAAERAALRVSAPAETAVVVAEA